MSSFLEKVAADLLKRFDQDLSRVAVVFPNSLYHHQRSLPQSLGVEGGRPYPTRL